MPGHGARLRYSFGTNVNTPFFKYPRQNSGTAPVLEYKVETLYSPKNICNLLAIVTQVSVTIFANLCLSFSSILSLTYFM